MTKFRLVAAVVALLAIVASPFAFSAGLWFGIPIVGGPTYCNANVAGTAGTLVCTVSTPAGPANLTGNELIPADLENQQATLTPGQAATGNTSGPQTGYLPVPSVASGAYNLTTNNGLTTVSTTSPNGVTNLYMQATGTITTWNVAPPAAPLDGELWRFGTDQVVTTLTLQTPGNAAVIDTPTKPTGMGGASAGNVTNGVAFTYLYNASRNTWFRLQ